jgi:hypothetical protein
MKFQSRVVVNFLLFTGTLLFKFCCKTSGQFVGPFPQKFIWAAATASYQVEGGWNASGMNL